MFSPTLIAEATALGIEADPTDTDADLRTLIAEARTIRAASPIIVDMQRDLADAGRLRWHGRRLEQVLAGL